MERKAKEYEKQLKQRDEEESQLNPQLSPRPISSDLNYTKQLEDAEDKEPEVIER